ncbi:MAG: PfkB family carbohydrate kinase [Candidatus Peregrinibacteria bacterium]|nr:PfkB family carbohydrate kinase [Candidatus Peregrinibacteria bacterium]
MTKILIVGSVAFDVIFSIPEDFRKSIPLENNEIRNFNATYIANQKQEFPGGTAGNIAFWCGHQDVPCSVLSAWGKDFEQKKYSKKLEQLKVDTRGNVGDFTAHAYMVSDPLHQQLIIWQPNAYEQNETQKLSDHFSNKEIENFEIAIFSAGSPSSIKKHLTEFRKKNKKAKIILDPGQVSQFFDGKDFSELCKKSDILIGNDIEFQHFKNYFTEPPQNLKMIETLGDKGVKLHDPKNNLEEIFTAEKVAKVVETTGAGDAFRAGFITKLLETNNYELAIKNGVHFGAKCVKLPSGQI